MSPFAVSSCHSLWLATLVFAWVSGCTPSTEQTSTRTERTSETSPVPLSGTELFASLCVSCHVSIDTFADKLQGKWGTLTTADIRGRIDTAVDTIPSMAGFRALTTVERDLIASSLVRSTEAPPRIDLTGADLFKNQCLSCHAPSTKAGKTKAEITQAINSVEAMGILKNLPAASIQSIANYLATQVPQATSGEPNASQLLAHTCSTCHLSASHLADSLVQRWGYLTRAQVRTKLDTALATVTDMSHFINLSAQTRDEISALLTTPPPAEQPQTPPPELSGAQLFSLYCTSCHMPASKAKVLASTISQAISQEPQMHSLASLSMPRIQRIADFLATIAPPAPPPTLTAQELMTQQCSSCHAGAEPLMLTLVQRWGYLTEGQVRAKLDAAISGLPQMAAFASLTSSIRDDLAGLLIGHQPLPNSPTPMPTPPEQTSEELFITYCSACHTRAAKSTATVASIETAIIQIPQMASLSSLAEDKIEKIEMYLAAGMPSIELRREAIIANRYHIETKLRQAFEPAMSTSNFAKLFTQIFTNNITIRRDAFGGNCVRNDLGCGGYEGTEAHLDLLMSPNPLRRGSLAALCNSALTAYGVIAKLLAADGISGTTITEDNIRSAFKRFYPTLSPSEELVAASMALVTAMTADQQTRGTIMTLIYREFCTHYLLEVL